MKRYFYLILVIFLTNFLFPTPTQVFWIVRVLVSLSVGIDTFALIRYMNDLNIDICFVRLFMILLVVMVENGLLLVGSIGVLFTHCLCVRVFLFFVMQPTLKDNLCLPSLLLIRVSFS